MFLGYYIIALAFTVAYSSALLVLLGRYSDDDPKKGAFQRWQIGVMTWAFNGVVCAFAAQTFSPEKALDIYRLLLVFWVFQPALGAEVVLSFIERVSWRRRAVLYGPYALFVLLAPFLDDPLAASGVGVPLPAGHTFSPAYACYISYSFFMLMMVLWRLSLHIRRHRGTLPQRERRILVFSCFLSVVMMVVGAALQMSLPGHVPSLTNLFLAPLNLIIYYALSKYGGLLEPQTIYQAMMRAAPSGIAHLRRGRVVWANPALATMLGRNGPVSMEGLALVELVAAKRNQGWDLLSLLDRLSLGQVRDEEIPLLRRDGRPLTCHVSSVPLNAGQPNEGALLLATDVSGIKSVQAELERSQERYRNLVDCSMDMIAVVQDQCCVFASEASRAMLGYDPEEIIGRGAEVFHPDDMEIARERYLQRVAGASEDKPFSARLVTRDGQAIWAELAAKDIVWEGRPALQVVFRNINDRVEAEEQRLLASKLEASVETAGAACHQLNQPLQTVLSQSELALLTMDAESPLHHRLTIINEQAQRMTRITQRLSRITEYRTTDYVGRERILDLVRASNRKA